jgi:hypothetical protein
MRIRRFRAETGVFMMRLLLIVTTFITLSVNLSAQTPCGNLANIPGKWTQKPATSKDAQIVRNINSAMSLFQKSVGGFAGGQATAYLFTSSWVDTRPYKFPGYTIAMNFLQFECVAGKIKPEGATDTWLYIGFNEFPFFIGNNSAGDDFRLPNGQQMFFSNYRLNGKFKSFSRLTPLHHTNSEAVFLSKSNRLPFRQVTQAEVMANYKKFFAKQRNETIKWQENILSREPSNQAARDIITENKKEITKCDSTIDSYLSRQTAKQPAFVEGINYYCEPEKMFLPPTDERAKQIVVFDESYFDKSLLPATPQFIVVYWRKGDANYQLSEGGFRYPVKREFIRKFEENFDFEAVQKMLVK